MPSTEKPGCKCGKHDGKVTPVVDFHDRVWHTVDECYPFPKWTEGKSVDEVMARAPFGWGIDRNNFFESTEEHPADCPCGNPRSKKHGFVCFVPNKGCFVHMEGLDHLDWKRIQYLAGVKRNDLHTFQQLIERVDRMTKQDYPALEFRMMKVTEETGELANAVGMFLRGARPGYPKLGVTQGDIVEEAVDVILTALSVARTVNPNVSSEDILRVAAGKLEKWQKWIDLKPPEEEK